MLYFSRNSTVSNNHFCFSLHTPHFTFNSSMALLPASLFNSAKKENKQTQVKQILSKKKKKNKRSEKGNPTCIKNCELFLLTFISRNCFCFADFLFNDFVLACFHLPLTVFLWTIVGVSLQWGVFDWIGWLDLSPRFLPLWTSTTIVLDPKVVIFSTTWTTIRKH